MGSDKLTRFNRRLKKSKKDKQDKNQYEDKTFNKDMEREKRRLEDRRVSRIRSFSEWVDKNPDDDPIDEEMEALLKHTSTNGEN